MLKSGKCDQFSITLEITTCYGSFGENSRVLWEAYKKRNVVERCLLWLKECRRVATRYEKLAATYAAMVNLAAIRRLLRKGAMA